jgi:hypothetical protein
VLLRRIIEHVKVQNWFAVGLDFVIVVAGVFIGLQVQQWSEARKDAVQHEKLLERFGEEFRDLEPVAAELVAFLHTSRKSTAEVIDALRREQPPEDEAAFRFALARANWVMNFPHVATAYEELVATGRLSEVRSIELRKALIGYEDAHGVQGRVDGIDALQAGLYQFDCTQLTGSYGGSQLAGGGEVQRTRKRGAWRGARACSCATHERSRNGAPADQS